MNMTEIKQLEKYCAYCGKRLERKRFANGRLEDFGVFSKRKYCSMTCMRKAFLKIGNNNQTYRVSHSTSQKINELILQRTTCENCGKSGNLDVHHIDGNYQNNNLENLKVLCRSCHIKEHRNKSLCKVCGKPMDGGLGYCDKHYRRYKKYGNPYIVKKCNGTITELEN
ncbi:MAG: HNH endonuclease [Eubacterium sp.]|nr:HNH endonuclease [Eubacterium sp.]